MAKLSAATRKKMPAKNFAGPNKSFPIEDKKHARLAISGATRSANAGNISPSEAAKIKTVAKAKLNTGAGKLAPKPVGKVNAKPKADHGMDSSMSPYQHDKMSHDSGDR